jgi:microcompartment protein CcmK/EutM
MKRGIIVGELWATRKAEGLVGSRLKLVALLPGPSAKPSPDPGDPSHPPHPPHPPHPTARSGRPGLPGLDNASLVVAVDTLDARDGQQVLVAFGSGARNVLVPGPHNRHVLCDAAVALLIDGDSEGASDSEDNNPAAGRAGRTGAT